MRIFGIIFALIGLIWGIIAFNISTIVETESTVIGSGEYSTYIPSQKIHNLDLSERRSTHLMISGLLIIVGTVIFGFGSIGQKSSAIQEMVRICPFCAESIKPEAIICKHCGKDIPYPQIHPNEIETPSIDVAEHIPSYKIKPIKTDSSLQPSMKICSSCSTTNNIENNICWKCHLQFS